MCTVHCIFFFSQSSICAIFSTVFLHCSYNVFHYLSTIPFWLATLSFFFFFSFFKFWTIAIVASGTVATIATFFFLFLFFFFSVLCLYFFFFSFYIYITVHPVFLRCTSTVPFCWATLSFYFFYFLFFKFWTIATVPSWFTQLCWAKIHYSTYNFFGLPFCIFFFFTHYFK